MSNQETLTFILDFMIPADHSRGLPAGSQVRIEDVLPRDFSVQELLDLAASLEQIVLGPGEQLNMIGADQFWQRIHEHRQTTDLAIREIGKWLLMAYYTDPRVRESIGVGARAPFPLGYTVPEGNLDLLEPVFTRGPIYRMVDHG